MTTSKTLTPEQQYDKSQLNDAPLTAIEAIRDNPCLVNHANYQEAINVVDTSETKSQKWLVGSFNWHWQRVS